jgi:hypothetical protein
VNFSLRTCEGSLRSGEFRERPERRCSDLQH